MLTERLLYISEIKILNQDLKRLDKRSTSQIKFLISWLILVAVFGSFFYFKLETKQEHYLLTAIVIIYSLIGCWSFADAWYRISSARKNLEFVLLNNKIKFIRVEAEGYIELPEYEDEGVHYLFQLPHNQILSMGGQDFYPTDKFPNTDFEIALCRGLNDEVVLLKTYTYGIKLLPIEKKQEKKKWNLIGNPNYPDPERFTIIPGQLVDIEDIILASK